MQHRTKGFGAREVAQEPQTRPFCFRMKGFVAPAVLVHDALPDPVSADHPTDGTSAGDIASRNAENDSFLGVDRNKWYLPV